MVDEARKDKDMDKKRLDTMVSTLDASRDCESERMETQRFNGMKESGNWNLVTRGKAVRVDSGVAVDIYKRREGSVSIYVDNLPHSMDWKWLQQVFSRYGDIADVSIPAKRSKSNTKFGFVRFFIKKEATRAIQELNEIIIRGHKIHAKLAMYPWKKLEDIQGKGSNKAKLNNYQCGVSTFSQKQIVREGNKGPKSYADMVRHNVQKDSMRMSPATGDGDITGTTVIPKTRAITSISVSTEGNDWLWRSAIGESHSLRPIESIKEAVKHELGPNILVRAAGGRKVILTFSSISEMEEVFNGGKTSWMKLWLSNISKWNPQLNIETHRSVWIYCFGVPLHTWSVSTFSKIGGLWGEVLNIDEETADELNNIYC